MSRSLVHLLIALAVLGGTLIAYGIAYQGLGKLSASVAATTEEVAAKKENASAAALAEEELKRLTIEEDAIRAYYVIPDDIVTFLEELQAKGTTLGTTVTVESVSANTAPRPHLDLSLNVTGTFDAVVRTVGAIEYSPYDLIVSNLTLDIAGAAEGDEPGVIRWTAGMKLMVGTASSTPYTP